MGLELKEVFIYNETYPLPKDAYLHYKGKVMACSSNPMCLNNVKSDVESFISKWGRKNGIKLEDDNQESSFIILSEDQDFDGSVENKGESGLNSNVARFGAMAIVLILAILSIYKKNVWIGIGTVAMFLLVILPMNKKKAFLASKK